MRWEERIAGAADPVELVRMARLKLEAWADAAREIWTQTGSDKHLRLVEEYGALASALRRAEEQLQHGRARGGAAGLTAL